MTDTEKHGSISPAHTTAHDVITTEPDPSWYLDDYGVESPTMFAPHEVGRPVRILAIGGTTSERSWSLVPMDLAIDKLRARGCEVTRTTIYDLNLPLFRTDWKLEDYPPTLPTLLDDIRAADGLLICSPTYHGTMSGAIKNVIDCLIFLGWDQPKYLGGKPVALIAFGGMTAMGVLTGLTQCVRGLKGVTVPTHLAVPERAVDHSTVAVTDDRVISRMDDMVEELVSYATRLRAPSRAPVVPANRYVLAASTQGRLAR